MTYRLEVTKLEPLSKEEKAAQDYSRRFNQNYSSNPETPDMKVVRVLVVELEETEYRTLKKAVMEVFV